MNNYDKLKSLIDEAEVLFAESVDGDSPELQAWKIQVEHFLAHAYGVDSVEVYRFREISFSPSGWFMESPSKSVLIDACKNGIEITKKVLEGFLDDFTNGYDLPSTTENSAPIDLTKVFIVHGHDEGVKQRVARILEKQDITPIILDEQANLGATIIEKFERHSDVGAAVCLFTADDEGKAKKESDCKARARQNVVLETGYFMGKLGRDRLVIIAEENIDLPSDMQGVVYVNSAGWELRLLNDLKTIGFKIDLNKVP